MLCTVHVVLRVLCTVHVVLRCVVHGSCSFALCCARFMVCVVLCTVQVLCCEFLISYNT